MTILFIIGIILLINLLDDGAIYNGVGKFVGYQKYTKAWLESYGRRFKYLNEYKYKKCCEEIGQELTDKIMAKYDLKIFYE